MISGKLFKGSVLSALIFALVISLGYAAGGGGAGGPGGGAGGPGAGAGGPGGGAGGGGGRGQRGMRGGFDRASIQERMLEMMQEQLGANDEEWTIIQPRLSKVMTLSMESGIGLMGGMFGGRGGRGGMMGMMGGRNRRDRNRDQEGETQEELSSVQQATVDLQQTLENEEAGAEEIKNKLLALRKAKEEAKQNIAKAQKSLREVLTVRQESRLVLMGYLE